MIGVYRNMAIALGITGLFAFLFASSPMLMNLIYGTPLRWLVMLAPLGMVIFMSTRFMYMSNESARLSLWVYAGLMGVSLSSIFLIYTGESIARAFFITASVFGGMSIYGYSTKKDLTSLNSFLMMGLLGIIIASLVNIFMQSGAVSFVVSIAAVIVFSLLTAYDTQRLKNVYYQLASDATTAEKVAIFGALCLYMDFINLFIQFMHFFGQRRD
jgi:FtsH-binding integral membrane protein